MRFTLDTWQIKNAVKINNYDATGGAETPPLRKASRIVQMQNYISTQTIAVRKVIGIVRKISLMVRMGNNPSGSRPNFFGRQHLTFDKGRAWMPEVERPEFRKDAKPTERS